MHAAQHLRHVEVGARHVGDREQRALQALGTFEAVDGALEPLRFEHAGERGHQVAAKRLPLVVVRHRGPQAVADHLQLDRPTLARLSALCAHGPGEAVAQATLAWQWHLAGELAQALGDLWADRGDDKGFHFHTITTDPNYTDPTAGPATVALWKYKAIYRLRDEQVGNWSDVISVAVGS